MTAERSRRDQVRAYGPLGVFVIALLMAIAILPSALSLPQTNPTQTLEYAPVPPTGQHQPPQQGNVSALALGTSSSGVAADGLGGTGPGGGLPAGTPQGVGAHPNQKDCVGSPPRQTEDELSPPCVAYFDGNNGGSTYKGVNSHEVRVVFYLWGNTTNCGWQDQCYVRPTSTLVDLAKPPTSSDVDEVRVLRIFQAYFNQRFQTYNRFVHFYVYFSGTDNTPEGRRQDATYVQSAVKPFAFITELNILNVDSFVDQMATGGSLLFGTIAGKPSSYYKSFPGRIWSYLPSIDVSAQLFASYVCTKVLGHPVSFGGNDGNADARLHTGQPRRLGLLYSADSTRPGYGAFAAVAKKDIEHCGGKFVDTASFPIADTDTDNQPKSQQAAQANMAQFLKDGITTVIWPEGWETSSTKAASQENYFPEWITAGDYMLEGTEQGFLQDQSEWTHAWTVTPVTRITSTTDTPCYQALMSADPNLDSTDAANACQATTYYTDLRQLFTGIQVAGPRLTPVAIDQGFHAIPSHASTDPTTPACFYYANDYTCVKDGEAEYWDPNGKDPNSSDVGCWREASGGRRFFSGQWPSGDVLSMKTNRDPCNGFDPAATLNSPRTS